MKTQEALELLASSFQGTCSSPGGEGIREGNQTGHPSWTSLNSQQGNAEPERPSELNGLKTLCGYSTPTS